MLFSSVLFLFYFFPVFFLLYFISGRSNLVILLSSLVFYAWGEPYNIGILVLFIVANWLFGRYIAGCQGGRRRAALAAAISFDVLLLVYFKYTNFIVDQVNALLLWLGSPVIQVSQIALPLGISFFTFQGISYLIDIHRGTVRAQRGLLAFATYKSMFPQLVAGPIVRYSQVASKIEHRRVSLLRAYFGLMLFILGLGQKMLVANNVAAPADMLFALPTESLTFAGAWFGVTCYTLQIDFDFSGYSNMAIGMGHMMGFGFPPNFNRPYVSQTITEFWRRWHISLSSWFRDYLYIPLGGNRGGTARTCANLFIVFLICGFWHGAGWTFAIWGLWHGGFLIVERLGLHRVLQRCWRPLRHAYAMLVVTVGWVFFRADSLPHAASFLRAMAGFGEAGAEAPPFQRYASPLVLTAIAAGCIFAVLRAPGVRTLWPRVSPAAAWPARGAIMQAGMSAACLCLLLASAITLATGSFNPFIYFRF